MEALTILFVAAFGLVFGSFLNVVIYRLPRGLNLSRPPSSCPGCGVRIRPCDNIPLLSYLILGGKCRECRQRISAVYPTVEALTAIGFVLVYFKAGRALSLELVADGIFTCALIVLGFIDYLDGYVYDAVTMPGLVLALAYSFFRKDLTFRGSLLGAAVGAGFLLLVFGAYYLVRKKKGLGMGDVTMMLMIGAYLGWERTFLTLVLASFVGTLVALFLLLRRVKTLQSALPLGVFFTPAAFVSLIWGERIIRAYWDYWRSVLG